MARPPFPASVTGDFFVVTYDRNGEHYTLHVDDADRSSYKLATLAIAMRMFELWGFGALGLRALDQAREYGAVQVVPKQDRVINLIERTNKAQPLFKDQEEIRGTYALPIG